MGKEILKCFRVLKEITWVSFYMYNTCREIQIWSSAEFLTWGNRLEMKLMTAMFPVGQAVSVFCLSSFLGFTSTW